MKSWKLKQKVHKEKQKVKNYFFILLVQDKNLNLNLKQQILIKLAPLYKTKAKQISSIKNNQTLKINWYRKRMQFDNNRQQVYQQLNQRNLNDIAIAAIMANIHVQTGGTFDYKIKQKGGNGYGLFQFDFLKKYYEEYLSINQQSDSIKMQIEFMLSTIQGQNKHIIGIQNANKINTVFNENNLTTATTIFCQLWEKPGIPHLDRRLAAAKEIYDNILKRKQQ